MTFQIALINPDIPQNTGNIGRLCVGLDITLHLVHPLGFVITDKQIRRTGLDYWSDLKLVEHESLEKFLDATKDYRHFYFTTKTDRLYSTIEYSKNDILVFGSESKGLPEDLLKKNSEKCVTLPMPGKVRSLNLSNSVAIGAYEAYRQITRP